MRALLECEAFQQSIGKGDTLWEEQIVASFYSLTRPLTPGSREEASVEWERKHRKFHTALLSACASPWLSSIIDLLQCHSERYPRLRLDQTENHFDGTHSHEQNEQLKQAALDRDAENAARLVQTHIEATAHLIQNHWETHKQTKYTTVDDRQMPAKSTLGGGTWSEKNKLSKSQAPSVRRCRMVLAWWHSRQP